MYPRNINEANLKCCSAAATFVDVEKGSCFQLLEQKFSLSQSSS